MTATLVAGPAPIVMQGVMSAMPQLPAVARTRKLPPYCDGTTRQKRVEPDASVVVCLSPIVPTGPDLVQRTRTPGRRTRRPSSSYSWATAVIRWPMPGVESSTVTRRPTGLLKLQIALPASR